MKYRAAIWLTNDKDRVSRKDIKLVLEKIIRYLGQNLKALASQLKVLA